MKNSQLSTLNSQFKKGFTLLEMLVVIGIISVLVGMGATSYSTAQKKARDARRKSDLRVIKNAMEQYYSLCYGSYPAASGGKVPAAIQSVAPPTCSLATVIMPSTPTDPKATVAYDYNAAAIPPSICATDGPLNLLESETTLYCVYLEQ